MMHGNKTIPASNTDLPIVPDPYRSSSAARWAVSLIVTAIISMLLIMQSLRMGALALPAVYDDVSYFSDAARRLLVFYRSGIWSGLADFTAGPPHAPLSTLLALTGFALFGIEHWAAVVANAILLHLFVRGFFAVAADLPLGQTALLAIALLGAPFFGVTILESRPDMFCSLFIAAGTIGIIATPWERSKRIQVLTGLAFGAALWAKPTVFHLTAALFWAAMFLASLPSFIRRDLKQPVTAGLITTVIAAIVALPYYLLAWRHVVNYIWTTVFGAQASIWVRKQTLIDHVLYYLTGPTGTVSLGIWLYIGIIISGAALAVIWRIGSRVTVTRTLLIAALVVVTYLAVTIPSFKGPHGLPFAAVFLCATAVASIVLVRHLPKFAAWAACIGIATASLLQFQWPYARARAPVDAAYAASRWEMLRQTFDATGPNVGGKSMLLTTSAVFVNPTVLQFEYYRRGLTPPNTSSVQELGNLAAHRKYIESSDIIFALTPDFQEYFSHLPTASPKFRAREIKLIEDSGLFDPAVRIPDPIKGGAVLIYKTRSVWATFASTENLRAIEGPYPQWSLPQVRWGQGAASKLVAEGPAGSQATLVIQARTVPISDQTLAVEVNGKETLPPTKMTYDFQHFAVPVAYDEQGRAEILLRYGTPAQEAVLYKALYIRK
jgi:hypothetical protein